MDLGTTLLMLITIILILVGFINKNSLFIFIIQIFWMYVLTAGNLMSIDMGVHQRIFIANQSNGNLDIYGTLCYLFGHEGFDFIEMNAVLCIFAFISLYCFIKKYTLNYCFVMSLYFLYPFIENVIQKRFFIASIVAIYAIIFIIKNGRIPKVVAIFLIYYSRFNTSSSFWFSYIFIITIIKKCKES